jgi:hypothetical protein
VAGLQCGLRADKRLWKADETPKLQAVARNVGRGPWRLPQPSQLFYLKVAGEIWRSKGPVSDKPPDLEPGDALDKTTILLSEDWVGPYDSDVRLKLSPGKHTIQLVMFVSDPVPPEAAAGTRPIPKHLRIESNVVVIEVLPKGEKPGTVEVEADSLAALQAEFDELRRQRQDPAAAEAFGKRLLEKYTEREEKSLVYYQLAEMYAQGGQINPSKVVEYAEAGWWYLHDPVKKARLFVYSGDALQLSKGRREAARIYLRGLEFCLQFGLPKDKPERPAAPYALDGPKEASEQYGKANQPEMAVWKQARRIEELIEHRNALTGKIVQLYAQAPDAFDELHELVVKYLSSEQAAQQLIAAAKAYQTNPSVAVPGITRIGPDPNPDADLHWGEPSEGIRVRLRAETRRWAADDVPKLKLDVRNDGSRILTLAPGPECWGLEVDGVWYKAAIPMLGGAKGMSFGPDKRWYNLELSLDRALGSQNDSGGLELSPGRHTIRAALSAGLSEDRAIVPLGAVSNPVEIQIAPKGQKTDVQVEGENRIEKLDTETLLSKVRKALQPTDNMRVSWQYETVEPFGWGTTKSPHTVIEYTATISGFKSRLEGLQKTYTSKASKDPYDIRRNTYVFDGKQCRNLEERIKGGKTTPLGWEKPQNVTVVLLYQELFACILPLHNKDELNEYKLNLVDSPSPGIYVIKVIGPEDGTPYQITIDGSRGFNIINTQWFGPKNTKTLEDTIDLRQYDDGIWYPAERRRIHYYPNGTQKLEHIQKFSKLELDVKVPEETFKLEFPPGTKTWDTTLEDWVIIGDTDTFGAKR